VNIIVVAGVNISYVYLALYQSQKVIIAVQLNTQIKISINEFFSCQLFVALTCNIVIPCITVLVKSPDCFYSFFIPDALVTSTFTDDECCNYE
jgi:hypothetical protein